MKSTLRKDMRGFTIIELIVVIAILALLALLAAPRFVGRSEDAKEAQILNDIFAAETIVQIHLINNGNLDSWETEENSDKIDSLIENKRLYSRKGLVSELSKEKLNIIPLSFISAEAGSSLEGTFYTDNNGNVYYDKGYSSNQETSGNFVLAQDYDFEKDDWGNWVYVGSDTHVIIPHVIEGEDITSYINMFRNTAVEGVISDNPNVTDMTHMFSFSYADSLILDLDTSNVTNMFGMFLEAEAEKLDVSGFDTSKVTDMSRMFSRTTSNELDLSTFDTSNVTTMFSMFSNSEAKSIDLSSFDTSNVTNMRWMFAFSNVESLDFSGFDTSKVTDMSEMFRSSESKQLNLSSFNTENVTDMHRMFQQAQAETFNFSSSFNTKNVTNMSLMFYGIIAEEIDVTSFDTRNVKTMLYMFSYSNLKELDLSSFETEQAEDMRLMFQFSNIERGYAKDEANAERLNESFSTNANEWIFTVKN